MTIEYISDLKDYDMSDFPTDLQTIPRIGDSILINSERIKYYRNKNLSTTLKVINVIWCKEGTIIELNN